MRRLMRFRWTICCGLLLVLAVCGAIEKGPWQVRQHDSHIVKCLDCKGNV